MVVFVLDCGSIIGWQRLIGDQVISCWCVSLALFQLTLQLHSFGIMIADVSHSNHYSKLESDYVTLRYVISLVA